MAELVVADTALRAAAALLRASLEEARAAVDRGDPVDRQLQARILIAGLQVCDVAVAATSTAHALGGGAAVYDGSRLLRARLDVQTGRQHLLFGSPATPGAGRCGGRPRHHLSAVPDVTSLVGLRPSALDGANAVPVQSSVRRQ
ncbi:MAG TPA: hypothetical protein VKD67_00435 [Acidimicrobiales bacterium]|nr:hypothetical protein [Acidimicrobiales bacterium]